MKTKAAVLYEQGKDRPYAESRPLVIETLDSAPEAFIGMLQGRNTGKQLVQMA